MSMKKLKTIGLAGLLLVPVLAVALGVLAPGVEVSALSLQDGVGTTQATDSDVPTTLTGEGGVFTTVVNVLLFVIGAVSVIMLIIGGIRYTVSGGDSNAVTGAKNTILYAIVGLLVAFFAFAIVNWIITDAL